MPTTNPASSPEIMVIDDAPEMVDLLCEMVHLLGYRTRPAYGPLDGLAQVADEEPDLILLDLMMPEMSGWEFYRRLRAQSRVPVIMITAIASREAQLQAQQLGMVGFVSKDVKLPKLKRLIDGALSGTTSTPA